MSRHETSPIEPYEDGQPAIDLSRDEVLGAIDLFDNPMAVENTTALRLSAAGLYMSTNDVVDSVLDRLEAGAYMSDEPDNVSHAQGDFLSNIDLRDLAALLEGLDSREERIKSTRLFMTSKHRRWVYRHQPRH